jgi:hypothetical protein
LAKMGMSDVLWLISNFYDVQEQNFPCNRRSGVKPEIEMRVPRSPLLCTCCVCKHRLVWWALEVSVCGCAYRPARLYRWTWTILLSSYRTGSLGLVACFLLPSDSQLCAAHVPVICQWPRVVTVGIIFSYPRHAFVGIPQYSVDSDRKQGGLVRSIEVPCRTGRRSRFPVIPTLPRLNLRAGLHRATEFLHVWRSGFLLTCDRFRGGQGCPA